MNSDMTAKRNKGKSKRKTTGLYPFRAAVFRGLGVVAPPLLTIVIFLWIGTTVQQNVLGPIVREVREALARTVRDVREEVPVDGLPSEARVKVEALEARIRLEAFPSQVRQGANVEQIDTEKAVSPSTVEELRSFRPVVDGEAYQRTEKGVYVPVGFRGLGNGTAIPADVYDAVYKAVAKSFQGSSIRPSADDYYSRYVDQEWLKPYLVVPCFLSLFVLTLYLLGKFMAARIGRFFWGTFERGVNQVPLVRNVYGAVKQVSDFILREREQEFSRVVAVEWPRKGIWSLAMVTGDSMIDIEAAANEPVMSVLIPTSPVPMTGFALTVKKSETIDLNISIDQAIQFIVSCGVAVPPGQMHLVAKAAKSRPSIADDDSPEPDDDSPEPDDDSPEPDDDSPEPDDDSLGSDD
jgi:uncharacterized membrane protein